MKKEEKEVYSEDELTCPYCGFVYSDSWELYDSSDEEYCEECGNVFSYERIVTCTYQSKTYDYTKKDATYSSVKNDTCNAYKKGVNTP